MSEGISVRIANQPLRCQHCEHRKFHHQTATVDRTHLGGLIGGTRRHADIYICVECGFNHWFTSLRGVPHERGDPLPEQRPAPRPRKPTDEPASDDACLSCGKIIPGTARQCPACGWSWSEAEKEEEAE